MFCSSDVWSIIREYERTTTAVIHGYVQPRVAHYLDSLQRALGERRRSRRAAGDEVERRRDERRAGQERLRAQMILSGTAAGVIGASFVSKLSGFGNTMSLDIGGTSADIAFIRGGMPQYGVGEMIGEFPIYIPTVAVTSIGAGGGSIAWVDDLGVLKVGPESAGSSPGPACYGRGGTNVPPSPTRSRCSDSSGSSSWKTAPSRSIRTGPAPPWPPWPSRIGLEPSRRPPRPSWTSRCRACTWRSASSSRATASTTGSSRCRRSEARARCSRASSRRSSV